MLSRKIALHVTGILGGALLVGGLASSASANLYENIEVKPLTLEECARCHTTHATAIKNNGARHSGVACTDCHQVFHAYNPLRNNYAEIMPKCSQCHDAPHGTDATVTQCLECHTNPHQPIAAIPDPASLEGRCRTCHSDIAGLLTAAPSKHTERQCSECHSQKHGRIPVCSECHENHSPMLALEAPDCMACHPVHQPLQISYPETQAKELCAGCHETAFNLLAASPYKHNQLTCAKCHPKHGYLPKCQECHGEPHSTAIHGKYPACGSCHTIAHDLQK